MYKSRYEYYEDHVFFHSLEFDWQASHYFLRYRKIESIKKLLEWNRT